MDLVDTTPFRHSPQQESHLLKIIKEDAPLSSDWAPGDPPEETPRSSIQAVRAAAADALREIASQYAERAIAAGRPYYSSANKPTSPFSRSLYNIHY